MSVMRKLGYSLLGLLAGDGALFAYFALATKGWRHDYPQLLVIFLVFVIFSFLGWIIAGVPAVLLMDISLIKRLHWIMVLLIGAVLGTIAPFPIFLVLDLTGHFDFAIYLGDVTSSLDLAMLVSTVAFAVYSALARRIPSAQ